MNAARFIAFITIVIALAHALAGCAGDGMLIPEVPRYGMVSVAGPDAAGRIFNMTVGNDGTVYMYGDRYDYWTSRRIEFVLVSNDEGETWIEREVETRFFDDLEVDGAGAVYLYSMSGRIFRSSDEAKTWTNIAETLPDDFDPSWSRLWPCKDGNVYLAGRSDGPLYYDVNEQAWISPYDSLPWSDDSILYSVAVSETGRFFAATSEGIWRGDGEDGWEKSDLSGFGMEEVRKILADGRGRIYAMGPFQYDYHSFHLISSDDDGGSWNELTPVCDYMEDFFVDMQDRLFVFGNYEAFRSDDGGSTYSGILFGQYFNGMAFGSGSDGSLFIYSSYGPGLQRSTDGGDTWKSLGFPSSGTEYIYVDSENNSYSLTQGSGVWRQREGETGWRCASVEYDMIRPLCMTEGPGGDLLAGTSRGVFTSSFGSPAWSRVGDDGPRMATDIVYTDENGVVACTPDGVFLLEYAGASWEYIGMDGYELTAIAECEGDLYVSADFGGVFRYGGEGTVWDQVNAGLESLEVTDLAVLPGEGLFALSAKKLFFLRKNRDDWKRFDEDSDLKFTALHVNQDVLYAGTPGKGIYWTCAPMSVMCECAVDPADPLVPDFSGLTIMAIRSGSSGALFLLCNRGMFRVSPLNLTGNGGAR